VSGAQPIHLIWWLVSRASGIVALVLITASVVIGLMMSAKVLRRPGLKRNLAKLHEHLALSALLAIGAHGLSLLGDHWLKPGWSGITVPFALSYRPGFTGLGIIGGYLAVLLGPSFYLRRRIGARRWRKLHTLILLVWILSAVHTLGAGTDAHTSWLQAIVLAPLVPIVYLLTLRILKPSRVPKSASRPPVAKFRGAELPRRLSAASYPASPVTETGPN
jgi:methionine sulfoxide reductase heme-binding subunit